MTKKQIMVITGTSKGIGKDAARFFADGERMVFGCGRSENSLPDIKNYKYTQVDVTSEVQVRQWFNSIKKHTDHIDALVCFAGIMPAGMLYAVSPKQTLDDVFSVTVGGTFIVCKEALKMMIPQRFGSIITISSMTAGIHMEGTSIYSASKSAVAEMSMVLAKEVAPLGITCNVIAPSVYNTDAAKALGEATIERLLDKQTIKRELKIEEICNVISFFMAPESKCITGQIIHMGLVN